MGDKEKHKHKQHKDKEKHRREDGPDAKTDSKPKSKKARLEEHVGREGVTQKKEKEKEKDKGKEKEKKRKDKEKERKEEETKENRSQEKQEDAKGKADRAGSPPGSGLGSPEGAKESAPPEKRLKAWQDDELELESGDEGGEPTKLQTLSSVAARSMGGQATSSEQAAEPEEVDALDAFMAELTKSEQDTAGGDAVQGHAAESRGLGVVEASRVKTITLEEVEALMGLRRAGPPGDDEDKKLEGTDVAGAALKEGHGDTELPLSSAGAATVVSGRIDPAAGGGLEQTKVDEDEARAEEEDKRFHEAFIAEMRKLRNSESDEFQASPVFTGSREGFVFKRGAAGVGYYRDVMAPPAAAPGPATASSTAPALAPLPSLKPPGSLEGETKTSKGDNEEEQSEDLESDEEEEEEEEVEGEAEGGKGETKEGSTEGKQSEKVEKAKGDADTGEVCHGSAPDCSASQSGASPPPSAAPEHVQAGTALAGSEERPVKVVETKKEARRRRREAKEAEARAKEAAAKIKAREGFGQEEEQRMDSDPDRSEESDEEPQESYFELVKRFTTKKTLPAVDHSTIDYKPFKKNIYIQVKEITVLKDHEVEDMRHTNGDIRVRGKNCPRPIKSFLQCGLPAKILKIMEKRDYEQPFPIQMQAIPALMCGRDVIGVAQTGSGKTLSYLLPAIRHVMDQPKLEDGDGPVVFVVAPTRELALQIQREANTFCKAVGLVSVCAYGGGPMGEQLSALKKGAELLVGTPGRLIDVLTTSNGRITNLRRVTFLVLDEADRMFDMGFEPQIGMFLQSTRPDKQVALFSATLPTHVEALARQVLKRPLEITVGERNTAATNVTQFVEVLEESQKFYRLLQLLGEWHEHGSIIIFVHQQKDVDEMFTELLKYGYPPLALHGGQDQHDRDFTLQDFKDGVSNILIATSVAARGIDVKQVILVINFKVPDHLEDYIHRIGRTGRAGKPGFAYTLIQPDEGDRAQDMVDALRQCNQQVPEKLKKLAEEYQVQVNSGEVKKRRRWGGFGGKGFKYDNSEKSRQQRDRAKAKRDLLIGENADAEDEEEDAKLAMDDKDGDKKDDSKKVDIVSSDPVSTAAGAAQIAARLQADMARAASAKASAPPPLPTPVPTAPAPAAASPAASAPAATATAAAAAPGAAAAAPAAAAAAPAAAAVTETAAAETSAATPVSAKGAPLAKDSAGDVKATSSASAKAKTPEPGGAPAAATAPVGPKARALSMRLQARLSEEEIEEQAAKMAEETLKTVDEEVREKRLPALKEKLKERLRKAEQEKDLAAAAPAVPPPPPKFKSPPPNPLMQALPLVPGVLPATGGAPNMVTKSIEQLQASMAKPGAGTAHLAMEQATLVSGAGPTAPPGMSMDELEINDYPQIARQKISHKEPLLAIEEMTGAKCQVKGQFFTSTQKLPEGARRLYVEIVGPTVVSVQKAKQEVRRMMEALSIRTLNIPGVSRAVMGTPGRYDPMVGK